MQTTFGFSQADTKTCSIRSKSSETDRIIGLKVNSKKTLMKINSRVETVEQFVLIGSKITFDGDYKK